LNFFRSTGGESDLTGLREIFSSDKELALLVIKAMICKDPAERPPASAICNYPIFWNSAKILGFFQVCIQNIFYFINFTSGFFPVQFID